MSYNENDFGSFGKSQQNQNENVNNSSDSSTGVDKGGTNNNTSKGESNNLNSGSNNLSGTTSSDSLGGAKGDNSKKLSEMSAAEKKQALAGDAVDYATGNYAGIADRHKEDIKDGAKKAAAAKAATGAAKTTAKAALISKGIGAVKGFLQMLAGFAKAIGGKIAGFFVAAGNFVASMLGIGATLATAIVGGTSALAATMIVVMITNLISMNVIQKNDYLVDCDPLAYEQMGSMTASEQANLAAEIAEKYASHSPPYNYTQTPTSGTQSFSTEPGEGLDCAHFVAKVLTEAKVDNVKEGAVSTVHESINWGDEPNNDITEASIKRGSVLIFKEGSSEAHTAIYLGNGKIAHAMDTAHGVCITDLNLDESTKKVYSGKTLSCVVYPYKGVQASYADIDSSSAAQDNREDYNKIASVCKAYGMDKIHIAGVLGNFMEEGGADVNSVEGIYNEPRKLGPKKQAALKNLSSYTQNTLFPLYSRSGLSINKSAYVASDGKYYCGLGLGQWTGPRSYKLLLFAQQLSQQWNTLETQLSYMFGVDSRASTIKTYKNKTFSSAEEAAAWWANNWEGNDHAMSVRKQKARQAYGNSYAYDMSYGQKILADASTASVDGGILADDLAFSNNAYAERFGDDGCGSMMRDASAWLATGEFVDGEVNGADCSYLSFDPNLIFNTLGHQGSQQCGVYSCAYGYTVLTGKCRVSGSPASNQAVANKYNGGTFACCQWGTMRLKSQEYGSSSARLADIWEEVAEKKKPVMVTVQGSGENHFVLVIGFKKSTQPGSPSPSDLVILDPAMSGESILCTYGNGFRTNFDGSHYGKIIYRFPDDATE